MRRPVPGYRTECDPGRHLRLAVPRLARAGSTRSELPQRLWLEHYAERVRHRRGQQRVLPAARARHVRGAGAPARPDDFVVAVKVSRYLTHIKRLRDPEEPVARFLERAAGLGRKLGPVLLQLPPTLRADAGRAGRDAGGCSRARCGWRSSRGTTSWWTDEVRDVLDRARRRAVLGRPARPPDHPAVAHRRLRLPAPARGPGAAPARGTAGRALVLGRPARRRVRRRRPVYVYFNNDPGGAAIRTRSPSPGWPRTVTCR